LTVADQSLHSVKAFSLPLFSSRKQVGVGKRLGGDTAGTADPSWPKGSSIPYNTVTSRSAAKDGVEEGDFHLQRWLLFRDWLGTGLLVLSFIFCLFHSRVKLSLSQPCVFSLLFLLFSPHPAGDGRASEWLCRCWPTM